MARRRAVSEKEEETKTSKPAFTPSEFDETDFIQGENRSAKMIYISLGVAIGAGILSFCMMRLVILLDMGGEFIVPIASPLLLAPLVLYLFGRFGIDIRTVEWKKWLENGSMFVLTWFVIWLVSMNPPFTDISPPNVTSPMIDLDVASGQNVTYVGDALMFIDDKETSLIPISDQSSVTGLTVFVMATDNWDLEKMEISVKRLQSGEWTDILSDLPLNVTKGKYKGGLELSKNTTDALKDIWFGGGIDVWEDHLYFCSIQITDSGSMVLKDGVELMVLFKAVDSSDRDSAEEVTFSLKIR